MNNFAKNAGLVIAGVIVGLLFFAVSTGGGKLGGVYQQTDRFSQADLTISGGTLTVATSNTATSTITGGCFQFYATSTATALKFQASTTPGIMYSQYGTCPNL